MIVDLGTGVKPLGDWIMEHDIKEGRKDINIFLTHTHWDHIMGFPMFPPIFSAGTNVTLHGPVSSTEDTLESIIGGQLSYRYWPVRQSDLSAHVEYCELKETTLDLGQGLTVTTKYLNHPIMCLGYRFEYEGKSIVTAYDHEPFRNLFPTDPADPAYNEEAALEGEAAAQEANAKLIDFFSGADVLIHDAQFNPAEYQKCVGWGHSPYTHAIDAACKAKVKKLIFFHHDPNRTDEQLSSFENTKVSEASAASGISMLVAREGLTVCA